MFKLSNLCIYLLTYNYMNIHYLKYAGTFIPPRILHPAQ